MIKKTNFLILDSVRSVLNVGSIFRTADAIGIDKIYLTGYCPTPLDRFGRLRDDFQKTSLGAKTKWEYIEDIKEVILKLKKEGFCIFSIEQNNNSIDYKDAKINLKNAIVMGNENFGVNKWVIDNSDYILEIPMNGFKNSLNVSVSAGIILYRLLDNKKKLN